MNKTRVKQGYRKAVKGANKGIKGAKGVVQASKSLAEKPITSMRQVKTGLSLIGQAVKDTASGIKDVAVGIFNDPNWWKGSVKPYLAINPSRPMNPSDLEDISKVGTRLGVGHLSSLEVNFNDIFSSPVLLSATSQMFQTIRNNLRSNLQYTLEDLQIYLKLVTNIMIETKMVERTLGWHNYTRSDIPEFHEAWVAYPVPTDWGRVNYSQRANTGDQFSEAISRVDILKSSVQQLPIPKRLGEFLAWLYGTVFTDPDSYNPQVYYVDATQVSLYLEPTDDTLTTFDPRSVTVQQIINQTAALLSKYGALIADLKRITDSYPDSIGLVDFVTPDMYKHIMLYDQEFVNFVINAYTGDASQGMKDSDFFRIDILQDILDDPGHIAAVTNGMGAILASNQFKAISVIAQNYYFMAGTTNMPRNIFKTSSNQVFGSISAYTQAEGLWVVRTNTSAMTRFTMSLTPTSSDTTVRLSSKVVWNTPSTGTLGFTNVYSENISEPGPFAGRATSWPAKALVLQGQVATGNLTAYIESDKVTVNYDESITIASPKLVFYINGNLANTYTIANDKISCQIVNKGWSAWQNWTFRFILNGTFTEFTATPIIDMFAISSTVLPVASPASGVYFSFGTSGSLYTINYEGLATTCAWLTQMFDYHIPYVIQDNISGAGQAPVTIQLFGPVELLKECYISAIYNKKELAAVVQQLYYNLIAIE